MDRVLHGTSNRGERNGCACLSEGQVRQIIKVRGHEKQAVTADRFGVSKSTIGAIQQGKRWSWLNRNSPHKSRIG
jgi:hypothetical protein